MPKDKFRDYAPRTRKDLLWCDRTSKKSKYIPKRLLARVEKLEAEKVPIRKILEVLGVN